MWTVLFYLLIFPFALIIIRFFYDLLFKRTVDELVSDKNIYESKGVSLHKIIRDHHITRIVYRDETLSMSSLDEQMGNYKSIHLSIPSYIIHKIKSQNPTLFKSIEIYGEDIKPIIKYLCSECIIIQQKDANGCVKGYRSKLKDGDSNLELATVESEIEKVFLEIDRYYSILWEFNFIKPGFRSLYISKVKSDWRPLKNEIPRNWMFDKFSIEWDRAWERKAMYDLNRNYF